MNKQRRFISCLQVFRAGALLFTALLFLSSCENDLQDVERISSRNLAVPVDKSTGVVIIYSDSAKVKGKMITPELLHFQTDKPYLEMNKGVTIILYDEKQQETSTVKSDYAIRRENEKTVELKRNVVATNQRGETFKSEELIWDEAKNRFYSDRLVSINTNGNLLFGTGFWANGDFSYYEVDRLTGDLNVAEKQGF